MTSLFCVATLANTLLPSIASSVVLHPLLSSHRQCRPMKQSNNKNHFVVRAFCSAAPKLWNGLSATLREQNSKNTFWERKNKQKNKQDLHVLREMDLLKLCTSYFFERNEHAVAAWTYPRSTNCQHHHHHHHNIWFVPWALRILLITLSWSKLAWFENARTDLNFHCCTAQRLHEPFCS